MLPVQGPDKNGPWEQEGSQPSLFYGLAALVTSAVDRSDFDTVSVRTPRSNLGDPSYPGNKNFALYSALSRPMQGVNLAVHLGRWLNVLLGAVTVLCTFTLAKQSFPSDRLAQILASGLVALNPQFLFISASFSNDSLVTALSSLTLVMLSRIGQPDSRHLVGLGQLVVLGLLLGLAALSKLQGLGLLILAGLVFMVRRRSTKM